MENQYNEETRSCSHCNGCGKELSLHEKKTLKDRCIECAQEIDYEPEAKCVLCGVKIETCEICEECAKDNAPYYRPENYCDDLKMDHLRQRI